MYISNDLSRRIAILIADYPADDASTLELRNLVAQERVLPLYCDMGGVFTINVEGEIRSFLWDDTLHGRIEYEPRIRNLVLFQGSIKYPELKSLITKPDDARVCGECDGTGIHPFAEKLNTNTIVCYCGGLGWIP